MKASKLKLATFLFAAISLSSAVAFAKSTPCTEATKIITCLEKNDPGIRQLAEKVESAYSARITRLPPKSQELLKDGQLRWEKLHNAACSAAESDLNSERHVNAIKACLSDRFNTRISILNMRCEVDKQNTVEEMSNWKTPWSKQIPKDFQIAGDMEAYEVSAVDVGTSSYNLPSTTLVAAQKTQGLLKNGHKILALCRAQERNGTWWIAYPLLDGNLEYVLQQDTHALSEK